MRIRCGSIHDAGITVSPVMVSRTSQAKVVVLRFSSSSMNFVTVDYIIHCETGLERSTVTVFGLLIGTLTATNAVRLTLARSAVVKGRSFSGCVITITQLTILNETRLSLKLEGVTVTKVCRCRTKEGRDERLMRRCLVSQKVSVSCAIGSYDATPTGRLLSETIRRTVGSGGSFTSALPVVSSDGVLYGWVVGCTTPR